MGDKSPKAKDRNKKQHDAAKDAKASAARTKAASQGSAADAAGKKGR